MLQKYDTFFAPRLLALAAAGAFTVSSPTLAQTECNLMDGYGNTLSAYVNEAQACSEASGSPEHGFEQELFSRINAERARNDLAPLALRTGLNQAAKTHTLDMSQRAYADHVDLEGRDHLYRIRALDRTYLFGAVGASVMQTEIGSDAGDIYVAMLEDAQNNANILNADFTHLGISVTRGENGNFVTILYTESEGELQTALPVILDKTQTIHANLEASETEAIGWRLVDVETQTRLAKGINPRLNPKRLDDIAVANLDIFVSDKTNIKFVRGPMVSAF